MTLKRCLDHAREFDWNWAANNLLSPTQRAEYERVEASALAEYRRIEAPALAEYERVQAPAWAEYKRAKAQAFFTASQVKG